MKLKRLINYLFENIEEAMKDGPPPGYIVEAIDSEDGYLTVRIVNAEDEEDVIGQIEASVIKTEFGNIWEMQSVSAQSGYGPLLYDIMIELAGPGDYMGDIGLMPDRRSVSESAHNVWKTYYKQRSDVEHDPLPNEWYENTSYPVYLKQVYYKVAGTPVIDRLIAKHIFNFI